MNSLSVYDFLHEIRHRDVDAVKKLLRQAKRQHIPLSEHIYPELGLILNALYDPCRDENIPFEQSYWQIIPDSGYEILELLRPYYDFGEQEKIYHNHFLYQPIMHGDVRMLEYLWQLEPIKYRCPHYTLALIMRYAIYDYCYMRLPVWDGLPESDNGYMLDLSAGNWLETLWHQAERCNIAPPEHLEFLLKHDCSPYGENISCHLDNPRLKLEVSLGDGAPGERVWTIEDCRINHRQGVDFEEVVKSVLRSGEYWNLTCVCGCPECAGVHQPVLSMRFGDVVRWRITQSDDDKDPKVYHLAIPVKEYISELEFLLEMVEKGIASSRIKETLEPAHTCFDTTSFCLNKVQRLRSWIHQELAGKELPDFNTKAAQKFITLNI